MVKHSVVRSPLLSLTSATFVARCLYRPALFSAGKDEAPTQAVKKKQENTVFCFGRDLSMEDQRNSHPPPMLYKRSHTNLPAVNFKFWCVCTVSVTSPAPRPLMHFVFAT